MRPGRVWLGAVLSTAALATVLVTVLGSSAQAAPAPAPAPAPTPAADPGPGFPEVAFTLRNSATDQCLAVLPPGQSRTAAVVVAPCDGKSDQRWIYDSPSKRLRVAKLGARWCLSAEGLVMDRCPNLRTDAYLWTRDDGIWTPTGSSSRYLGVARATDGSLQVVLAPPKDAGKGFDWTVTPVGKPRPA